MTNILNTSILLNTIKKMIKLKCKNELIHKTFNNLLDQKRIILGNTNNENASILQIEEYNDKITLFFNKFKKNYFKPISLNILMTDLVIEFSKINYEIGNTLFFPYLRKICNNQKKIFLSDIQNIILFKLIEYPQGINKNKLYSLIWTQDKNVSINKLDTHLTNLKSLLSEKLNFEINFTSFEKNLQLIID